MPVQEHRITVSAPPGLVYSLIADVGQWPRIFPPTVHVEYLERSGTEERIRLWATANGEVKTWTSRRSLDPGARRIEFRQEVSQPPVASMGGVWVIESRPGSGCVVRLSHDYRAVDDDPAGLAWIEQAVDRNSEAELAALKATAELGAEADRLQLTFDDTMRSTGTARELYDFVHDAASWPERLPHVASVSLTENARGVQLLEMDTKTADGSTHTTTSVRVCMPSYKIVYKQTVLPALMTVHTGSWFFEDSADGAVATSRHTVQLKPSAVAGVLGAGATIEDARDFVREALGANSMATLGHAASFAGRAVLDRSPG